MLTNKFTDLFIELNDFRKEFASQLEIRSLLRNLSVKRYNRKGDLTDGKVMCIDLLFHFDQFVHFKHFYTQNICKHLNDFFLDLISYVRLNTLKEVILLYSKYIGLGESRGVLHIDSALLSVFHVKRNKQHQVFKNLAKKGKLTMKGLFLGFHLHQIIKNKGELLSFYLTLLFQDGIQLITKLRKNMKQYNFSGAEAFLLRKKALVESVNAQLKNSCEIRYLRYRSLEEFLTNLIKRPTPLCFFLQKPPLRIIPM